MNLLGCRAHQGRFRGWDACFLENAFVRLALVPDIGGRAMAYDLGDYPFLFVDPVLAGQLFTPAENQGDGTLAAWKNYGGDKTWPAPQGWDNDDQWHGPPDPVLDTGRYRLTALEGADRSASAQMVSPPDARTGLQITRRFTLGSASSRVRLDLGFRNISERTRRWSLWDVVQLQAERTLPDGSTTYDPRCIITTPVHPRSRFPGGFQIMFGAADNPQWQVEPESGLFQAAYQWHIGKVGLDSQAGWLAFSNTRAGCAFCESFPVEPGADYPDGGATVEFWTVGAGQVANLNYEDSGIYLMETEVLSPFFTLEPGAEAHFALEWASCRCNGVVREVQAGGAATVLLQARRLSAQTVQTTFVGGVFDAGMLELRALDAAGRVIGVLALGSAHPLAAISIDRIDPLPDAACTLQLVNQTADGDRLLAQSVITIPGSV